MRTGDANIVVTSSHEYVQLGYPRSRLTPSPVRLSALGAVLAGRYRVFEKLGSGGNGEVYRAMDEQTQSSVAVKLFQVSAARHQEVPSHLFESALSASSIRHQNIVQVHDVGHSELGPFIIMEDLRGEHVGRLLERHGRLKKESCFAIIEPVLLALGAAHSIGLMHGDVKPENVLVCQLPDNRVTVKLVDFGSKALSPEPPQSSAAIGHYSPEQLEGNPTDPRTDQFAACVLLYELLTNSSPFHGPSASATAYRILNLPCPTLEQAGLQQSDALSTVLLRGLEKNPADRYPSVRDLLDALRPLMQSDAPAALLLSDLLPFSALLRKDSGTIPASSSISQRPRSPSIPGPESGARLAAAAKRPSLIPSSPSVDSLVPVLPARYRGRYRARAVIWQSLDGYVRARRPANLRERILYDIGTEDASDLLLGTLQGIVYCDLDSISQYIELATARLFPEDPLWCRYAGREAVDGVLSAALTRSIPPTPNVAVSVRRACRILGPMFDFGEWQIDEVRPNNDASMTKAGSAPSHVVVTISSIDAVCQGLRLWILGLLDRALSVAHQRASLTVSRGEGAFTPRMVIEVATE